MMKFFMTYHAKTHKSYYNNQVKVGYVWHKFHLISRLNYVAAVLNCMTPRCDSPLTKILFI